MNEDVWLNALPNEAVSMLLGAVGGRRNKNRCLDFVRWAVASKLHYRTREGFTLVRGSDTSADGLKEDLFLKFLGFTQGKIRGCIKTLLESDIIQKIEVRTAENADGSRWKINWRRQCRNPPTRFRFSRWFLDALRAGLKVAKSPLENPPATYNAVTRIAQGLEIGSPYTGDLGFSPSLIAHNPPQNSVNGLGLKVHSALDRMIVRVVAQVTGSPGSPVEGVTPTCGEGTLDEDCWTGMDQSWVRDWPTMVSITPESHPQVYDARRQIHASVLAWLDAHIGTKRYSVHWFAQRGLSDSMRKWAPLDLWSKAGISRDIRIGFVREADAMAFQTRWGGCYAAGGMADIEDKNLA